MFEAAKGLLVLVAGWGLLTLAHHNLQKFALELVQHLHLNPASHYPHIFVAAAAGINNSRLWLLASLALAYSCGRLIEAYGLWRQRNWAKIFAIATGAIYLPIEIYELIERVTAVRTAVFTVNLFIVIVLVYERLLNAAVDTHASQ